VEKVKGRVFAVLSSTAPFDVELEREGTRTMASGRKIVTAGFKRIKIIETSGSANTITFYAGSDDIDLGVAVNDDGLTNAVIVPEAATPALFVKTNNNPGTPVSLTAATAKFQKATILGKKALAGTNNANPVKIGPSASAGQQPYVIEPGGEIVLEAPFGKKWDFINWYLDPQTAGDGVVVIYTPA